MADRQKVKHLENDYTKQINNASQSARGDGGHMSKLRKKRAMIILGIFLVFVAVFSAQIIYSKVNLHSVQTQVVTSKKQLAKQKKDNSKLTEEVKLLHNNDYMQKLIRAKYFYTKPGETVYSFPSDKATDVTAK
ncbi:FtsB family cell division protein [Secundilactobacillus malefermentans]|mgnify:CR=1 FL=1|uniref:Septum formation initiator n=1 Tax=Secundilactobacillus malefermentans TaxID=176292 RepID=A0A4V3A443_9LACO|nr:septum formation initiator family protein [Secundilactobacillus malefermentans]KRM56436.1 hypothetical protein FD44_GL001712 [Secundilactobacillus malefermentans DSM 5705 = KCTC 3548]QEA31959.1 septum formation initiator family protein [Secundilactobacillus malefermentans]TDG78789.1 hypothetical protein C5L31_001099 [Secundilactobacillus malefermentans]